MTRNDPQEGAYLAPRLLPHRFCAARYPAGWRAPATPARDARTRLLRQNQYKWINGTQLRYWFFDKPGAWAGSEAQRAIVRSAFAKWKAVGIGLSFLEVERRAEADVRIAFEKGGGHWSWLGTDVLTPRDDPRTMNLDHEADEEAFLETALHEIGHTLGFPHEHQNPIAGITWDEAAVYRQMAAAPNKWSRATTRHNILDKLPQDDVQGSSWDPKSVMHYWFEPGLILEPARYRKGLYPPGGLSTRDRKWARHFYPPIPEKAKARER